jgi:predicted deacylase
MHTGLVHDLDFDRPDFDRPGRNEGFLSIPFSIDRSPYFQVKIPVLRVTGGPGPRLVLMAGNHGDEYEGEMALARLWRRLTPEALSGTVTLLPIANAPAAREGRRRSPLDGGNLNRAFPGDPSGTPTARLAHFLESELFPRHDVIFDLHSGGTTMEHLPCALIETQGDPSRQARALDLMRALGMPHGFVADNGASAPTSMGAARRAGAIGLSGEFGGGGTVTPDSMAATCRAIDLLLIRLGMTQAPLLGSHDAPGPMRLLSLSRHSQGLYASHRGWFEPAVRLGEAVAAGQIAGWYHDLERPGLAEAELRFAEGGVVLSRRLPCAAEAGDCLLQVAEPLEG